MGLRFRAHAVVLTVGTFLDGKIHIGDTNYSGGRAGDPPANALAERLRARPFRVDRLKTGTPPRIDRKTIDFSAPRGTAGRRSAAGILDHGQRVDMHPSRSAATSRIPTKNARHHSRGAASLAVV